MEMIGLRSHVSADLRNTISDMARTLGNALHRLQAFVQPHVKHVITQTFEQADEQEFGDKSESAVHLLRQAIRIQRGEQVDQITALLSNSQAAR
jgi:hypothetical protein